MPKQMTYLMMSRKAPAIMAELLLRLPSLDTRQPISKATALMISAFNGHIDCTRALLAAGATLNLQDKNGFTAIICSIRRADNDIRHLRALLAAGADVNLSMNRGLTPLMEVLANDDNPRREYVDALIDAGTRFDLVDNNGESIISYVQRMFCPAVELHYIQQMVKGGCPRHAEDLRRTIRSCNYDHTIWMIMHGYDVNALSYLHEIIGKKHDLGLLVAFLAFGADVNRSGRALYSNFHMTPLIYALSESWTECVPILLKAGANCNPLHGDSALVALFKARHGVPSDYVALVHQLLTAGADPNYLDSNDCSPMQAAIESDCGASIPVLLAAGADVNLVNGRGYSLLSVAAHYKRPHLLRVLLDAGATNIDHPTMNHGFTPLMRAVENGCVESVRILLAAGANHSLLNGFGKTVFNTAIWKLHRAVDPSIQGVFRTIIALLKAAPV
jgi:ankyrin repeat protein